MRWCPWRAARRGAKDDAEIRERLLADMQSGMGARRDGQRRGARRRRGLRGAIIDERQREALKVAAENIPGVKAVEDHLIWIEPTSGIVIEPPEEATKH